MSTAAAMTNAVARVLVVDDTEANRDLLTRRLERQGHDVTCAVDGRQALEILQHEAFDLVLLDIMMPVMDGFELLERMRADDALMHLPVIMISALNDSESVSRAIAMGADDHLPKPFDRRILKARVEASLARKRLHDMEQHHARELERELDIARDIQAGFLPRHLPAVPGWDLAAWFQPARRVGGDFYDAFPVVGGQHMALVIADVCDKGVGAALFMALFRSLVRARAEAMPLRRGDATAQLEALVVSVNEYIARTHGDANMFATLFVGMLDTTSGELVYVNGGHEQPLICQGTSVRCELQPTGPAVGMLSGMKFQARRERIDPGERLVLFTDGIVDARNAVGEAFSRRRLQAGVQASQAGSAADTVQTIRRAVDRYADNDEQFDDLTLLVVRRDEVAE